MLATFIIMATLRFKCRDLTARVRTRVPTTERLMAVVFECFHRANVDGMMNVSLKGFISYSQVSFLENVVALCSGS